MDEVLPTSNHPPIRKKIRRWGISLMRIFDAAKNPLTVMVLAEQVATSPTYQWLIELVGHLL